MKMNETIIKCETSGGNRVTNKLLKVSSKQVTWIRRDLITRTRRSFITQ